MHTPGADQLVVRQHERFLCRLAATVRVQDSCADQVSLARNLGDGGGAFGATVVDCSSGGLGLEAPIFLPRGARLTVTLGDNPESPDDASALTVRVQRVTMTDRKPTYYLGGSFVGQGPQHERTVAAAINAAKLNMAEASPPATQDGRAG